MENLTENKYLRRELHSQTLNNYCFKPGNILRWRDRSVFSNIVKLNCRDRDIEWSQSWCLGGFWEGEVRAEMNDLSVRPRLAAVWMFDAKGYSGETGADMRWIWLRLASPSHYSPAQRGGCPPIGQTSVDISAGGEGAWFLTGIHNRAVMWHKARSEEGETPGSPGIIIDTIVRWQLPELVWSALVCLNETLINWECFHSLPICFNFSKWCKYRGMWPLKKDHPDLGHSLCFCWRTCLSWDDSW